MEKGKAPAHKKASTPAKTKLAPKETQIPPCETELVLVQVSLDQILFLFLSYALFLTPASEKVVPIQLSRMILEEFGGSSRNSHSRRTESKDIVVDDPMQSDDVEEVVELAQTNPKPEEILILLAKVAKAGYGPPACNV